MKKGKYKLGIWVRDDTQGIGTLTYVDENGRLRCTWPRDQRCGYRQTFKYRRWKSLQRPDPGDPERRKTEIPGELSGLIRYEADNILGEISENSKNGIFGNCGC